MTRSRMLRWFSLSLLLLCFPAPVLFAETIELVTYYPAPGGGGTVGTDRLHAGRATIGDPYSMTSPVGDEDEPLPNGTLLVAGPVGIGPDFIGGRPIGALEVQGNALVRGRVKVKAPNNSDSVFIAERDAINQLVGLRLYDEDHYDWTLGYPANGTDNFQISSGDTTLVTRLFIERTTGNVGIGTTAPAGRLHVQGADDATSNVLFMPGADNAGVAGVPDIRVGIGTAAPATRLQVAGGGVSVGPVALLAGSPMQAPGSFITTGAANAIYFARRNLAVWPAVAAAGDAYAWYSPDATRASFWVSGVGDLFSVTSAGRVGIGTTAPRASLDVANGAGIFNTYVYLNNPGAAAGVRTWMMYAASGATGGLYLAHPNGDVVGGVADNFIAMYYNSGVKTTAVWGFVNASDARLKTDITPLAGALEKLDSLQGVRFHWKDQPADRRYHMGLLAQDMEKVFPDLVYTGSDGMKAIASVEMIGVLTEAVKELKAENEALRERVEKLERGGAREE